MAIGTSLAGSMSQLYDPTSSSAETTYLIIMGGVPVLLGLVLLLRRR